MIITNIIRTYDICFAWTCFPGIRTFRRNPFHRNLFCRSNFSEEMFHQMDISSKIYLFYYLFIILSIFIKTLTKKQLQQIS
jgi:hypothetical protein